MCYFVTVDLLSVLKFLMFLIWRIYSTCLPLGNIFIKVLESVCSDSISLLVLVMWEKLKLLLLLSHAISDLSI